MGTICNRFALFSSLLTMFLLFFEVTLFAQLGGGGSTPEDYFSKRGLIKWDVYGKDSVALIDVYAQGTGLKFKVYNQYLDLIQSGTLFDDVDDEHPDPLRLFTMDNYVYVLYLTGSNTLKLVKFDNELNITSAAVSDSSGDFELGSPDLSGVYNYPDFNAGINNDSGSIFVVSSYHTTNDNGGIILQKFDSTTLDALTDVKIVVDAAVEVWIPRFSVKDSDSIYIAASTKGTTHYTLFTGLYTISTGTLSSLFAVSDKIKPGDLSAPLSFSTVIARGVYKLFTEKNTGNLLVTYWEEDSGLYNLYMTSVTPGGLQVYSSGAIAVDTENTKRFNYRAFYNEKTDAVMVSYDIVPVSDKLIKLQGIKDVGSSTPAYLFTQPHVILEAGNIMGSTVVGNIEFYGMESDWDTFFGYSDAGIFTREFRIFRLKDVVSGSAITEDVLVKNFTSSVINYVSIVAYDLGCFASYQTWVSGSAPVNVDVRFSSLNDPQVPSGIKLEYDYPVAEVKYGWNDTGADGYVLLEKPVESSDEGGQSFGGGEKEVLSTDWNLLADADSSTGYTTDMVAGEKEVVLRSYNSSLFLDNAYLFSSEISESLSVCVLEPSEVVEIKQAEFFAGLYDIKIETGALAATENHLYMGTPAGDFHKIAELTIDQTVYTLEGLEKGATYLFLVQASDGMCFSKYSDIASLVLPGDPLDGSEGPEESLSSFAKELSGSSAAKSSCYTATAFYRSSMNSALKGLYNLRRAVLKMNVPGGYIVALYGGLSQKVATSIILKKYSFYSLLTCYPIILFSCLIFALKRSCHQISQ